MLSTLSILLLLLSEADVQLSLFKASAVWLLMQRAPSCSFALLLSYLQCARLGAQILFHVNQRFRSAECQLEITSKLIIVINPATPVLGIFNKCLAGGSHGLLNSQTQLVKLNQANTRLMSHIQWATVYNETTTVSCQTDRYLRVHVQ